MKTSASPTDTPPSEASAVTCITSLDQFSQIACAERDYQFELNGKACKVRIRPLDAEESAELEKITDRIVPPMKDGFPNKEDAGYQERLAQAWDERRLLTFDIGLLSFKVPEGDLRGRVKVLKKKLPPGVPHEIFLQILKITSSPIENGIFTTSGDSQSIPS
jgi:hypothetical protein